MHLDPGAVPEHPVDVFLEHLGGQPERRNAPDHHAAEPVGQLVDVDLIARLGEILGGRQPRRAGPHDADRLFLGHGHRGQVIVLAQSLHHEALEVADRERPVTLGPPAGGLAGRIAHPPADRAERVGRGDRLERLLESLLPDVGEIGGGIRADRAGDLAGRWHVIGIARIVGDVRRQALRRAEAVLVERHR